MHSRSREGVEFIQMALTISTLSCNDHKILLGYNRKTQAQKHKHEI